MGGRVWYTYPDGKISIVSLTRDRLEESMDVLEKSFLQHEHFCKALGVPDDPIAIQDLKNLSRATAEDGISFIAIEHAENSKGRVVGIVLSKLQVNKPGPSFFEKQAAQCKSEPGRELIQLMMDIDAKCELFDTYKVDCIAEIMFISVLPGYTNRQLGSFLGLANMELLIFLYCGLNLKEDLDGKPLPNKPLPQGVSCLYTSVFVKEMWKAFPETFYDIPIEIPYKGFVRKGIHFEEFVDTRIHEKIGVVYGGYDRFTRENFDEYFRVHGLAKQEYVKFARRTAFVFVSGSTTRYKL